MKEFITKRPVYSFFVLAYALTWLFTIPLVYSWHYLVDQSFEPWLLLFLPGQYGPTIAALIVTYLSAGRSAVVNLLGRLIIWRVHWRWYAFALLLPAAAIAIAIAISGFRGIALESLNPGEIIGSAPLLLLLALPFGPLGEELGWRGFAVPKLLERYSVLHASLIIGTLWTFWHTPMFWFYGAAIPSYFEVSLASVFIYFARTLAEAILFTVLFVRSRGSVLLAVLFHAAINASHSILFSGMGEPDASQNQEIYLLTAGLMWVFALLALKFSSDSNVNSRSGAGVTLG